MKVLSLAAAIAAVATTASAAVVEVDAGSYNMDASGNTQINFGGTFGTSYVVKPTEAGILGTFSTLIQRRGDAQGTLSVSLFDGASLVAGQRPMILATQTIDIGTLAMETLADPFAYTQIDLDFSNFAVSVTTDSMVGFLFETDTFVTLDLAANRQDTPDPLPADDTSTRYVFLNNSTLFGGADTNFDQAYALTVLQEGDIPVDVVPLPAGAPLLLAGLGGLAALRRRGG